MARNPNISFKTPKIDVNSFVFGKKPGREPLPSKKKNEVKKRAKNTCEYKGCKHKLNLQFHHKNMKNSDSRLSNIELLCPNHHAKRHSQKIRKVVSKNMATGEKKTRLVKKTKKKKTKRKTRTKNNNTDFYLGFFK
ncbi:MAG: hypothetical protein KKF46_01990 [Nanoarchaeota archaeon]|nr:hypothetical protein [Nanoarchaeota archaeon]MBU1321104.1 hypothetical protein [Nanoarchaeota archaeon]MBU1597625.1 hypothetical protein [Nanoarchaeota archaeon]MBU2441388.1 hypothetical protein [Nanoarchaeota archaeon]